MSRTIVRERAARRAYRCEAQPTRSCTRTIQVGQRHEVTSLPPESGDNASEHWWTIRVCLPCRDSHRDERFRWVQTYYDVPASLGAPLIYDGQSGSIRDVDDGRLVVDLDSGRRIYVHPTWKVTYPEVAA